MSIPDRLVVFAHGKESGPWGTKITYLSSVARAQGFAVISPDYSHTHDPRERLAHLCSLAPVAGQTLVLVGSSMGAYVSAMACAALKPNALLLLAPALYFAGWDEEPTAIPALSAVVHGWRDDIVPVERGIRFAQRNNSHLYVLDSDHGLNDQLPFLGQCLGLLLDQSVQHASPARPAP